MPHLPKSILPALLLLFFNFSTHAQTTFDSAGRLATLKISRGIIEPPVAPLQDTGTYIKEQVRWLLLQKAQEAIRIVKSNNYRKPQHKLYLQIWKGDSASLLNYLGEVEMALQSGSIANVGGQNGPAFNEIFNKHLSDTATVFRWRALSEREGVLVKKDVFKSFITDYYNKTLPDITGSYVNKEDIIEAGYYLLEQPGNINALMNAYRSSLSQFRKKLYDSLRNYHVNLTSASSPYTKSLTLLRNDWFKEWFWITGGEIRINPIDFGVDTITPKQVSDLSETGITTRSPGDIFLEQRLDSLDHYFNLMNPRVATVEKWVNKVSVPADSLYFEFSAIDRIRFSNNEKELKRNLYVDETKTLVIHNITADRKAGLREDRRAIPNRSAFQEGLEEVISDFDDLAKAYGQVTGAPWLLVSNFIAPKPNYKKTAITPPNKFNQNWADSILYTITIEISSYEVFTVSGTRGDDFLADIKAVLKKDNLLATPIFNNVFGTARVTFGQAAVAPYRVNFGKLLDQYLALITQEAAKQIGEDSFMVAGMIHIYNTASSPLLKPIKTNQDKAFRYYSSNLKTTPLDSTVENVVRPYTVLSKTNSDSVFIGKFTYKIGKTKRFTLSAGLAYTLNSYDQSVAKAENGAISISNTSQQFRFVVGLNVYFGKGLYSLNNDLGRFRERWYGFIGVGIPKSIENLYIGIGRDLYPGLKMTAGMHVAKQNKYLIQNNQIVEERLRYRPAGPFVSIAIDPASLVNLLNVFKK